MIKIASRTAVALLATSFVFSSGSADARASGDGFIGPVVFGDSALDQSIAATNRELQQRDYQNDLVAELTRPTFFDYAAVVVALRDGLPEPDPAPLPATEFASAVAGDKSLEEKVAAIHADIRDDQFHVFLELARASDPSLEDNFDDGGLETSEFGPSISGDTTLNAKVAHVFDLIGSEKASTLLADAPAPIFSDAELDQITPAVTGNGG